MTLDGVFDAETMDTWWQNTNSPVELRLAHKKEKSSATGSTYHR